MIILWLLFDGLVEQTVNKDSLVHRGQADSTGKVPLNEDDTELMEVFWGMEGKIQNCEMSVN